MNIPVVLIVPAVAALGVGGGWYYRVNELEAARRDAALREVEQRADERALERDTARAEAARHAAERDEARGKLSEALATLSERTKERDGARSETARVAAERDATGAREAAQKERADALAEAVQRSNRVATLVNEDVRRAVQGVSDAQDALHKGPTPQTFDAFRASLAGADAAIKAAQTAIQEFTLFLTERAGVLAGHTADLDPVRQRFARTTTFLDDWSARVTETLTGCRGQSFTVRSDEEWQTSHMAVEEGECVAFYSSGEWRLNESQAVDARGQDGGPQHRLAGEFRNGALLGRVRGSELVHHAVGLIRADSAGRLEFRINDRAYTDNEGALEVLIWAWKPIAFE